MCFLLKNLKVVLFDFRRLNPLVVFSFQALKCGFVWLQTSERTLDAPGLLDDYCLNLLDWGINDVLVIALGNAVYLWDDDDPIELVTVDDEIGPVTSVKWAPDGHHISVGLNNSDVQIWDCSTLRLVLNINLVFVTLVS